MANKQAAEKKEGWFSGSSFKAAGNTNTKGVAIVGARMAVAGTAVAAIAGGITLAGFTSSGIAAGSYAAKIQSSIGNIPAGSAFAQLQSTAALKIVYMVGVGGVIVGAVGLGYGGYKWYQSASKIEAKPKL